VKGSRATRLGEKIIERAFPARKGQWLFQKCKKHTIIPSGSIEDLCRAKGTASTVKGRALEQGACPGKDYLFVARWGKEKYLTRGENTEAFKRGNFESDEKGKDGRRARQDLYTEEYQGEIRPIGASQERHQKLISKNLCLRKTERAAPRDQSHLPDK